MTTGSGFAVADPGETETAGSVCGCRLDVAAVSGGLVIKARAYDAAGRKEPRYENAADEVRITRKKGSRPICFSTMLTGVGVGVGAGAAEVGVAAGGPTGGSGGKLGITGALGVLGTVGGMGAVGGMGLMIAA